MLLPLLGPPGSSRCSIFQGQREQAIEVALAQVTWPNQPVPIRRAVLAIVWTHNEQKPRPQPEFEPTMDYLEWATFLQFPSFHAVLNSDG